MKKILLLLIIILQLSCSNVEDIYNVKEKFIEVYDTKYYTDINAVTSEMKQPLLIEDFNNNSNNWQVGNANGITATIVSGYFYMRNATSSGTYSSSILLSSLLQNDNYQIEIAFKTNDILGNVSPKFNGLEFGFDNVGIKYNFFAEDLNTPKTIDLSATGNNLSNKLFSIQSENMNSYWTQYNKYIIRKIGGKIALFINNKYEKTIDAAPTFYGNRIGFAFNQTLQVDYLYINKLNL